MMDTESQTESTLPEPVAPPQISLTDIPITSENVALNVMVSFLNTAQRRGAFSFDESAKIWECIKIFIAKKQSEEEQKEEESESVAENITLENA
jgi:hypothetical protein